MNLFGHGIALSGDFVIQGAPKLTADAAGLPVSSVVSASVPLVIVMGIVTTSVAFSSYEKNFIQAYLYKSLFHQLRLLKRSLHYLLGQKMARYLYSDRICHRYPLHDSI